MCSATSSVQYIYYGKVVFGSFVCCEVASPAMQSLTLAVKIDSEPNFQLFQESFHCVQPFLSVPIICVGLLVRRFGLHLIVIGPPPGLLKTSSVVSVVW